jgi:putative ABC transport system permease protein
MRPPGEVSGSLRSWEQVRAGLRLTLGAIAYRRSTAALLLGLAILASTAVVVAPLYSAAAQDSIVRDTLNRADRFARTVHLDVPETNADGGPAPVLGIVDEDVRRALGPPVFGAPIVSRATSGVAEPTTGPRAGGQVEVPLTERQDLCAHLRLSAGRCPTDTAEVAMTTRSARLLGLRLGGQVIVTLPKNPRPDGSPGTARLLLVGTTEPFSVDDGYWAGRRLFGYVPIGRAQPNGADSLPPITDTALLAPGSAIALGIQGYTLDVPVDARRTGPQEGLPAAAAVTRLRTGFALRGVALTSQFPALVVDAVRHGEAVRVAAPAAAFQLAVLAWVILAQVVSAATQERSPELGLAKLRGQTPARTVGFGLAEVAVLVVVAAPIGTLVAWWLVRLAAVALLEPGSRASFGPSAVAYVLLGLLGGLAAAALAARSVARGPVADLLRRIPATSDRRRAGIVEGLVLALVVVGVGQLALVRARIPGPVAAAAPGMVAVGAALVTARMMRLVSRRRAGRALTQGRPAALLGWAALARRAGAARTTGVLAAALCLLLVGAQAWAVGARERQARALAETGAAVVLDVRAPAPSLVLAEVRAADPSGRYAMAVQRLAGSNLSTAALAVDSTRAAAVAGFVGRGPRDVGGALRAGVAPSVRLGPGTVRAGVDVSSIQSRSPLVLSVTLATGEGRGGMDGGVATGAWREVDLGTLRVGRRTYSGVVPDACRPGCRLVGLAVTHRSTDVAGSRARLVVRGLVAGSMDGPTDALRPGAWRPGTDDGASRVVLSAGSGLVAQVATTSGFPARIVRGDSPDTLPAIVVPDSSASTGSTGSTGGESSAVPIAVTGADGLSARARPTAAAEFVPGLGRQAVMVDLELALRRVPTAQPGGTQVWLSRADPAAEAALRVRLQRSGVQITDRVTAADLRRRLDHEGAVLALLLFLACGAVAVLAAVGALVIAAVVERRQRSVELSSLRVVGVPRRVLLRALLVENLAGVGMALVGAIAAAAVSVPVVLPALRLADETSAVLTPSTLADPTAFAASMGVLAAGLAVLAIALAVVQQPGRRRSDDADSTKGRNR